MTVKIIAESKGNTRKNTESLRIYASIKQQPDPNVKLRIRHDIIFVKIVA